MNIIFVGTKNFEFFSPVLLGGVEKIIITSHDYKIPYDIESVSKVIRVNELYDANSKTKKLDVQDCITKLSSLITKNGVFRIFCNQEANLDVAEELREKYDIYDHMKGRVDIYRDKIIMKKAVSFKNLRVPKFMDLGEDYFINDFHNLKEILGEKFIIKPSSSVGSRGVCKIFTESDFINFVNETSNDGCHYEAEEFISGELYEFDTALQNGEVLYSNISRYSCPMADLQEGTTLGSIMISRESALHSRIRHFGEECLRALGALNGCFHLELFHSHNDELVFLEVAARSPGLMTVPAYYQWEGVNMYDVELLIQCGLPASDAALPPQGHQSFPSFFVVYPKVSGKVISLNMPDLDAEIDVDWHVSPGQDVADTTTNIDYAARFFVTCTSEDAARKAFVFLTEEFKAVDYA